MVEVVDCSFAPAVSWIFGLLSAFIGGMIVGHNVLPARVIKKDDED